MDFDGLFIKSLKNDDLITLKKIPKTDLHNHSSRGANRKYFEKKYNANLGFVPRFHDIESMNYWYDKTFHNFADGSEGFRDRLISLFIEANEENIQYFSPMFCLSMKKHFNNSLIEYFSYIKYISNLYAPNTILLPELSLSREEEISTKELKEILNYNFFKSVDLMGDEKLSIDSFVPIYRICNEQGLILKAHVGEFTSSDFVEEAIKKLNLDVINHGLSIIDSKYLMEKVSNLGIVVNISPSSNYYLRRCDYKDNPIKIMHNNNIITTINTDDLLIFNQSLSEEYLNLYKNNVLNEYELNEIRNNGIKYSLKKRRGN